jgi:hypothetical protein
MARSAHPLLTGDQLNRATLGRQLLLAPVALDPVAAIERVAGLQAQEPASPYLGLWTRLVDFDPSALERAFRERQVVKATLMRATLHVASAEDYVRLLPAMLPMLRGLTRRERGGLPDAARLDELTEAGLAHAHRPRANPDMRDHLAELAVEYAGDDAWWWVRRSAPFVHVPGDVPWSFGRRPSFVAARTWLAGTAFADEAASLEHMVRRYLAAFGPASVPDLGAWSRLPTGRFRPAIAALDDVGELRRFSDERGRELLDLADSPIPDGDVIAPPRYLPMWDSVLLAHADRTRVIADDHRQVVIAKNGDTLPTFLVDGRVAGLWWAEADGGTTHIVREPFGRIPRTVERELDREGERLAAFVAPFEPAVYARYRTSRARRAPR